MGEEDRGDEKEFRETMQNGFRELSHDYCDIRFEDNSNQCHDNLS